MERGRGKGKGGGADRDIYTNAAKNRYLRSQNHQSLSPTTIATPPLRFAPPHALLPPLPSYATPSKYFGRLKQVGKPPEKRTATVDVDASRRFINAALAGDSVWQNAKSTDSASAQQKRAEAGIGRSGPAGAPENLNTAHHDESAAAAAAAAAGTPAGSAATGGATAGEKPFGGGSRGSSSSKRKHEAAAGGDDGWESKARGGPKGKRRSVGGGGGGGGSAVGSSAAAADPQWGDRPRAAVPGETPRAAKKGKGGSGGNNKKKPARYHAW